MNDDSRSLDTTGSQSLISEWTMNNTNYEFSPPTNDNAENTTTGKQNEIIELISIYYQNVRGLRTKSKDFFLNASASNYEIIALSETWLTSAHHSEEYFPSNYIVYRCDRQNTVNNERRGGGTLIAVSSSIASEQLRLTDNNHLEYTCVKLSLSNLAIIVYCSYVKPNPSFDTIQGHVDLINLISYGTNDLLLVVGDFNLPDIDWIRNGDECNYIATNTTSPTAHLLFDFMDMHNMKQLNNLPNIYGNLLDLFYSSDIDCVQIIEATTPISAIDIAHRPFYATIELLECVPFVSSSNERHFNFRSADYDSINEAFYAIDISTMASLNTAAATEFLYENISSAFHRFVPITSHQSNNNPPWYDSELINLKNRKS